MPKLHFDFLVMETFDRLFGAIALLDILDSAIPAMEWSEQNALKQLAEAEHWDFGDYDLQKRVLTEKFRHWVPTLTSYSLVILLYSIAETQLFAYARRVGNAQGTRFTVDDLKGRGIQQAALYIERLMSRNVKQDAAWEHLVNLQNLRNAIVHRGGKRGESPEHQKTMDRLLEAYPGKVSFPTESSSVYGEVWISVHLCKEFAREIEAFFKRLFKSGGLAHTGINLES